MSRRFFLLLALTVALAAALAPPALAGYASLWSVPADSAAQMAADGPNPTLVWAQAGSVGTELVAQRYSRDGAPAAGPVTLVANVAGLTRWLAQPDGSGGTVIAWADAAGAIMVGAFDEFGTARYAATQVCDAATAAGIRPGASATLTGLEVSGEGDTYVLLTLSTPDPAGKHGNSLLGCVSSTGVAGRPTHVLAAGTAAAMAADNAGHICLLLGAPGRSGVAVRRYAPDLSPDWSRPISPYPLGAPTASAQEPLAITGGNGAIVAWREGSQVKAQRYDATGYRIWPSPPAVNLTGDVRLAADGFAGCYLVGTSADGVLAHHIWAAGLHFGAAGGTPLATGVGDPRLAAVDVNRTGDIAVAYRDAGPGGKAAIARMTYLGEVLSAPALTPAPAEIAALEGDGAGGTYALSTGSHARLWRLGPDGTALTIRSRVSSVTYGRAVEVSGYLTGNGAPVSGKNVELSVPDGAGGYVRANATTEGDGYYTARIAPGVNCVCSALARDVGGATASADTGTVLVNPKVTLALAHQPLVGRYLETFSGKVTPAHAGSRVLLQKRNRDGAWVTLRSSRLNSRSRYRIRWLVPHRTATYTLRVTLPAHADHAVGASPTAWLRVVQSGAPPAPRSKACPRQP